MSYSGHVPIDHADGPACCWEGCTKHRVITPEEMTEWYQARGIFSPILPVPVGETKAEDRRDPRRDDYVVGCPPGTHAPKRPDLWWANPAARDVFRDALIDLINFHNVDAVANTPDYVLADFLMATLDAWDQTTARRDVWRS